MRGATNAYFARFTERNLEIAAALETVAGEIGRSMAQVAINWVAHRPGVATVLIGATNKSQLADNLMALDFAIPAELTARLDAVSAPSPGSPYTFFAPGVQAQMVGARAVADKPASYAPRKLIAGSGPGFKGVADKYSTT